MATQVQFRGGTTSEHSTFTGVAREVTVDTTKKTVVVHDGSTAGGIPLAKESAVTSAAAITGGSINGTTVGASTASTGAFTTLSASSTVSGAGFSTYLASPPAIGGTTASTGRFTTVTATGLTSGRVTFAGASGLLTDSANLLYSGTDLTVYGLTVGRGAGASALNTVLGANALAANTTGSRTVAVGDNALLVNTTGIRLVAVGSEALTTNTTGSYNTGVGWRAMQNNTTGEYNTAVGSTALNLNTTASNNTAVGYQAGYSTTTGANNTFIGYTAGTAVTTGSNLTVIGNTAAASAVGATNEITLGNSSIATLRCQVTTITALSDSRDKENIQELQAGLDFVNKLKPVSFDWNMRDGGKVGIADTGFIAQDLKQVQVDTGITIPNLVYEENPERLEAGYGKLLPVLVKAIQELKAEFDAYKATHP